MYVHQKVQTTKVPLVKQRIKTSVFGSLIFYLACFGHEIIKNKIIYRTKHDVPILLDVSERQDETSHDLRNIKTRFLFLNGSNLNLIFHKEILPRSLLLTEVANFFFFFFHIFDLLLQYLHWMVSSIYHDFV